VAGQQALCGIINVSVEAGTARERKGRREKREREREGKRAI